MKKEHHNYKKRTKYFCVAFGTLVPVFFFVLFGAIPVQAASVGSMVINEILYDPPADIAGDANYDGYRSAINDEFVEIVNVTEYAIDMELWTLWDLSNLRHTFPDNTIIQPGYAIVIFGGGSPEDSVWSYTTVQTASSGSLGLANTGDTVILKDPSETVIWDYTYSGVVTEQSINLSSDLNISDPIMVAHSSVHVSGDLFSPGFTLNGEEFDSSPVPIPGAAWLLGSGLIGLMGIRRKFNK